MIFVTVGTHEQPFNRLIKEIDRLKKEKIIEEEVIIQTGYCTYEPKYCTCYQMLSYDQMEEYVKKARIVITHGGPASFIAPLTIGKTPIVVPRKKRHKEHVNDHQFLFCNELSDRGYNIIVVNTIYDLQNAIVNYDEIKKHNVRLVSNNSKFVSDLKELIDNLF